ncbi:MAG: hypothetical protein APF76_04075 [Desulfitibacter sp. BRH_c19]|nr:MAG: hypothetical protein APF76_04075 [Desulfitibacter sp. BRH_c19]
MDLKEIIKIQEEFDQNHSSKFNWNKKITNDNLEMLEFILISMFGEIGETANLVKKIIRGDFKLDEKRSALSEEIADIFIYLIKLSNQLDIDLEQSYFNKLEKNRKRFQRYEIE